MSTTISTTELARNLADVLDRVRNRGEQFTVERDGEPIASLGPATTAIGVSRAEFLARLGDLTMPGDGFADDLEAIQREQPITEPPAWPN
jgi:antitoxin (DNA-binding transcriptional repressor) of toxin-antitoxin stability system